MLVTMPVTYLQLQVDTALQYNFKYKDNLFYF